MDTALTLVWVFEKFLSKLSHSLSVCCIKIYSSTEKDLLYFNTQSSLSPLQSMELDWVLCHWRALRTAGKHLLATIRLTLGAVLGERWDVEDRGPEETMVIEVGRDGGSGSGENGKMERNG